MLSFDRPYSMSLIENTGQRSGLETQRGHLVAVRKPFLRMMRSSFFWCSDLTLHLFGVAKMESQVGGNLKTSVLIDPCLFHISTSHILLLSELMQSGIS